MEPKTSAFVSDVSEMEFSAQVIERSNQVPVLVDFWAPWCGPCLTLGPILEELAEHAQGAWFLAKVNADEWPGLARDHRVMGIPAVKAFMDGRIADEFVGALPRYQVEAFVRTVLETAASDRARRGARDSLRAGNLIAARTALAAVPADAPFAEHARTISSLLDRATYADDASSPRAHFEHGSALLARGDFAGAIVELLDVVRLDRGFEDEAGRRSLLALFALLGDEDPLTHDARGKLGAVLF